MFNTILTLAGSPNSHYNVQNFENERIICMGMIITVDGPSGAGKGTLCYALAEKLGYAFY
ncbi:hypothetical protein CHBNIV1_15690 [Haemophilus influenzae]|nr:hypothetical protein CHBNIV1_15690 [Haemophilus influenzae]